jgi:hypothetical protein
MRAVTVHTLYDPIDMKQSSSAYDDVKVRSISWDAKSPKMIQPAACSMRSSNWNNASAHNTRAHSHRYRRLSHCRQIWGAVAKQTQQAYQSEDEYSTGTLGTYFSKACDANSQCNIKQKQQQDAHEFEGRGHVFGSNRVKIVTFA